MIFPFTLNGIYNRINLADGFQDSRVGVRGGGYSDFFMNIFKEKRELLNNQEVKNFKNSKVFICG